MCACACASEQAGVVGRVLMLCVRALSCVCAHARVCVCVFQCEYAPTTLTPTSTPSTPTPTELLTLANITLCQQYSLLLANTTLCQKYHGSAIQTDDQTSSPSSQSNITSSPNAST